MLFFLHLRKLGAWLRCNISSKSGDTFAKKHSQEILEFEEIKRCILADHESIAFLFQPISKMLVSTNENIQNTQVVC